MLTRYIIVTSQLGKMVRSLKDHSVKVVSTSEYAGESRVTVETDWRTYYRLRYLGVDIEPVSDNRTISRALNGLDN